jgi:hypothetical protein
LAVSGKLRFLLGFSLGLILLVTAFPPMAIGHGTYASLVFSASLLGLSPVIGFFAPPFLWGAYFVAIRLIESSRIRTLMISLIVILHLAPGAWIASKDPAFARAMNQDYGWLANFFGSLMITIAEFVINWFAIQAIVKGRNPLTCRPD